MKDLLFDILEMAARCGATGARARIDCGFEDAVSALDGVIDRIETSEGKVLVLKLFMNGRMGVFSTNRFEKGQLRDFVSHSVELTSLMESDECNVMPDPSLYYRYSESDPDLMQYDSASERLTAEELKNMALECSGAVAANAAGGLVLSSETEAGRSITHSYLADSAGFYGAEDSSTLSISAQCSVQDKSGRRPEEFWYDMTNGSKKLDCADCGRIAIQRAFSRIGAKKIKAGIYDVVLDTDVAAKFVSPIISSLSGPALYHKNSFLPGSLGNKIFASGMNIREMPHLPGAVGASFFDSEGIATKNCPVIEDGYVCKYFLSTYFSKKLGMTATGAGPAVIEMKGRGSRRELLAKLGRGLLVTSFLGGNHNTSTGDFSYGISGFLIENGAVSAPVDGMNVTGNFLDVWGREVLAADDCRGMSSKRIPSLAFSGLNIS